MVSAAVEDGWPDTEVEKQMRQLRESGKEGRESSPHPASSAQPLAFSSCSTLCTWRIGPAIIDGYRGPDQTFLPFSLRASKVTTGIDRHLHKMSSHHSTWSIYSNNSVFIWTGKCVSLGNATSCNYIYIHIYHLDLYVSN